MNQNQNNFHIFKNLIICISSVCVCVCVCVQLLAPLEMPNFLGGSTPFPDT